MFLAWKPRIGFPILLKDPILCGVRFGSMNNYGEALKTTIILVHEQFRGVFVVVLFFLNNTGTEGFPAAHLEPPRPVCPHHVCQPLASKKWACEVHGGVCVCVCARVRFFFWCVSVCFVYIHICVHLCVRGGVSGWLCREPHGVPLLEGGFPYFPFRPSRAGLLEFICRGP